jgi:hypothetical protein
MCEKLTADENMTIQTFYKDGIEEEEITKKARK